MQSSNDSKKNELYDHLFKSIKSGFGVDVEREPEDPIKAFHDGKYPELNHSGAIAVMYYCGRKRGLPPTAFFQNYPPVLRDYLQELLEKAFSSGQNRSLHTESSQDGNRGT